MNPSVDAAIAKLAEEVKPRPERTKRCTRCEGDFPVSEMLWRKGKPSTVCLGCHDERQREYQARHRATGNKRRYRSRSRFYAVMLSRQGEEVCLICGEAPETEGGLVIDHCHESGKPRGLLCNPCNLALGHFRDDPQRMQNAIDYLRKFG